MKIAVVGKGGSGEDEARRPPRPAPGRTGPDAAPRDPVRYSRLAAEFQLLNRSPELVDC